jgi:hypothetical protein
MTPARTHASVNSDWRALGTFSDPLQQTMGAWLGGMRIGGIGPPGVCKITLIGLSILR